MSSSFVIEALKPEHDRDTFSCGVEPLDRYLKTQAGQDIRRRVANCFVATPVDQNTVAGYFTLSAASLPITDLPEDTAKKLPRYPVLPAGLIGRLAVDKKYRGRSLGAALLFDAIQRAAAAELAAFTMIVDAKDDNALAFYRHFGFLPLPSRSHRLFLPITTATKLLAKP